MCTFDTIRCIQYNSKMKQVFLVIVLISNSLWTIGQGPGNSLDFDGTNDYMKVVNHPSLQITGNLSMEMWFKGSGADWFDSGIGAKNGCGFAYAGVGGANDHKIYWHVNGVGSLTSTSIFTDNKWHHVAGTFDGSALSLYVDGVLENQVAATGSCNMGTADMLFATRSDFVNYINISLDEFRIWNSGRTQAQIRDNMCKELNGNEAGLIGYWRFNEGTGITVDDTSSNSNTGTLN